MRDAPRRVAARWLLGRAHAAAFEREADVSKRLVNRLMAEGHSFGNVSAHRPDQSRRRNKEAMLRLQRELQRRGYRPVSTYSTWTDDKTGKQYQERSFLVPDARPEDMFELGRMFQQDSVIYKSRAGALGMYYTGRNPRALLAQDEQGRPSFDVQPIKAPKKEKGPGPRGKEREQEELFSRSRGLNFTFDFDWGAEHPWDGRTPIDARGKPDPGDLGRSPGGKPEGRPEPRPAGGSAEWETYLRRFWDGGRRKVPNTNRETRDRYPKVEMLTLMKTDPRFRHRVRQDYRRRREQARAQASPAVG